MLIFYKFVAPHVFLILIFQYITGTQNYILAEY